MPLNNNDPVRLPGAPPSSLRLEHYYTPQELDALAVEFAKLIPGEAFSVAELQGYLLNRKLDPKGAVDNISAWVKDQEEERFRMEQEKLKRRLQFAQKMKAEDDEPLTVLEESGTRIQGNENAVAANDSDFSSPPSPSIVESVGDIADETVQLE